jgi:hypothetical protein
MKPTEQERETALQEMEQLVELAVPHITAMYETFTDAFPDKPLKMQMTMVAFLLSAVLRSLTPDQRESTIDFINKLLVDQLSDEPGLFPDRLRIHL